MIEFIRSLEAEEHNLDKAISFLRVRRTVLVFDGKMEKPTQFAAH